MGAHADAEERRGRQNHSVIGLTEDMSVMGDALFVGITVGFFVLTWALLRLCERL